VCASCYGTRVGGVSSPFVRWDVAAMELRFSVSVDRIIFAEKVAMDAALLLLMLEAVNADLVFTISLKRTQNLQLSTSSPADYPI
jgi:hypothetical protein